MIVNSSIHVFLIDNVDSFTYNLVDELRAMGIELTVYRNTVASETVLSRMRQAANTQQVLLMLSPGPGEPSKAGNMPALLRQVAGEFPVLGICLGHQAIVEQYGGDIVRAEDVMHGKASLVTHSQQGPFADLPSPLPVARYHSLMAANTPPDLAIIAQVGNVPMAVLHEQHSMLGFQFHPESILTSQGSQLIQQSLAYLTNNGNKDLS